MSQSRYPHISASEKNAAAEEHLQVPQNHHANSIAENDGESHRVQETGGSHASQISRGLKLPSSSMRDFTSPSRLHRDKSPQSWGLE